MYMVIDSAVHLLPLPAAVGAVSKLITQFSEVLAPHSLGSGKGICSLIAWVCW